MKFTNLKSLYWTSLLTAIPYFAQAKAPSVQAEQPNVIFILVDDLSYFATTPYGATKVSTAKGAKKTKPISTPNMQRLAQEGVQCNYAYAHALSEATRVALMTGMNNGRNFLVPKALHDSQITFGDAFQRAGYKTGMFGKWKQSRGTAQIPAKEHISAFGWDEYACFDVVGALQRYINPDLVINDEIKNLHGTVEHDPVTGRRYYGPDMFNYMALDFIEKHQDEPFFLYYPMVLIHSEHRPTPDTQPASLFEEMTENKKYNKIEYLSDMISYADKMIGRVVDKVDELGLRDETIIVVMGDNGSHSMTFTLKDGKTHIGGKGRTTYAGERVPLIFNYPKKLAPQRYDGLVDLTDLYPTFMQACGVEVPNADQIDGVSFWEQLQDADRKPHREVIYKWYNANRTQASDSLVARYAQNLDYKYYAPCDSCPEGRFFDLQADPYEQCGAEGPETRGPVGSSNKWRMGIPLNELNAKQKQALKLLGKVNAQHAYQKVDRIEIQKAPKSLAVGQQLQLQHQVFPKNATRNGVIWESSNPKVARINKFGEVEALQPGKVTITLYSWDDAWPVATGKTGGYRRDGLKSTLDLTIN